MAYVQKDQLRLLVCMTINYPVDASVSVDEFLSSTQGQDPTMVFKRLQEVIPALTTFNLGDYDPRIEYDPNVDHSAFIAAGSVVPRVILTSAPNIALETSEGLDAIDSHLMRNLFNALRTMFMPEQLQQMLELLLSDGDGDDEAGGGEDFVVDLHTDDASGATNNTDDFTKN